MSELDPTVRATVPTEPPFPDVAVLLGDPRLPDPVKRTGLFAEEDFDAFLRMKSAFGEVSELRGHRFHYLDGLRRTLPGRALLIQEFLEGAEYGIGLIGNPGLSYPNFLEQILDAAQRRAAG